MKFHRAFLALSVVALLTAFTACQRNTNGVQAAREERATTDNVSNPGATADTGDKNTLSPEDRNVAFKIEQTNIEEMDLGRFVRDKTNNSDVKDYAKMLIDDHNDAQNKLQNILKDKDVNRSTTAKPEDETAKMNTLQNSAAPEFDRQYLSMMVQDHQKDLDELHSDEATVQDQDLKKYIEDIIPVIQKHLDKAESIQNNLSKTENR